MISAWWLVAAIPAGIITGFALCLLLAIFAIHDLPMNGGHYTGDFDDADETDAHWGEHGDDSDYDQFLTDLNHRDAS